MGSYLLFRLLLVQGNPCIEYATLLKYSIAPQAIIHSLSNNFYICLSVPGAGPQMIPLVQIRNLEMEKPLKICLVEGKKEREEDRERESGGEGERMEGRRKGKYFLFSKHLGNTTISPNQMSTFSPFRLFYCYLCCWPCCLWRNSKR